MSCRYPVQRSAAISGMCCFCLVSAIIFAPSGQLAQAQNLSWKTPLGGNYSNTNNWLPSNVPDNPNETAIFNLFGNYAVNFDQSVGSSVEAMRVTAGTLRFYSSTSDQTYSTTNGILVEGATLELNRKTSPGDIHLSTNGQLTLNDGAVLKSLEQSSLVASSTSIGAGNQSDATELYLDDDAIASLGDTSVSDTGSGSFDGLLSVLNGSVATVGDLNIATTGQANRKGAVQVFSGGTVNQSEGVTTVGANSEDGQATLFAGFGAQFLGDEVHVYQNGKITNSGSHFAFASGFLIDGGVYLETGNATRSFGANATMSLLNQAEITLTNAALQLNAGQVIDVDASTLNSNVGILINGGTLNTLGTTPQINAPIDLLINGTISVSSGTTARFMQAVTNNEGAITLEAGAIAEFENDYQGTGTMGPGMARFSGAFSPGMSPGIVNFSGDVEWTEEAQLVVEIGGTSLGSWDQSIIGGNALLDGELVIELLDLGNGVYQPTAGDVFQIIQSASHQGTFEMINLPTLATGNRWVINYQTNGVQLSVVGEGDFNGDGQVDAADYTVWRDQLGQSGQYLAADENSDGVVSELDYGAWLANYGTSYVATANGRALASADGTDFFGELAQPIPEPYPLTLLSFGVILGTPMRQTVKV